MFCLRGRLLETCCALSRHVDVLSLPECSGLVGLFFHSASCVHFLFRRPVPDLPALPPLQAKSFLYFLSFLPVWPFSCDCFMCFLHTFFTSFCLKTATLGNFLLLFLNFLSQSLWEPCCVFICISLPSSHHLMFLFYSLVSENLMTVYHRKLHDSQKGRTDAVLIVALVVCSLFGLVFFAVEAFWQHFEEFYFFFCLVHYLNIVPNI